MVTKSSANKSMTQTEIHLAAAEQWQITPTEFARLLEEKPGLALRMLATPMVLDAAWRGDGKGAKAFRKITTPFTQRARRAAVALGVWQIIVASLGAIVLMMCWVQFPLYFGLITTSLAALLSVPVIVAGIRRSQKNTRTTATAELNDVLAEQIERALANAADIELDSAD